MSASAAVPICPNCREVLSPVILDDPRPLSLPVCAFCSQPLPGPWWILLDKDALVPKDSHFVLVVSAPDGLILPFDQAMAQSLVRAGVTQALRDQAAAADFEAARDAAVALSRAIEGLAGPTPGPDKEA